MYHTTTQQRDDKNVQKSVTHSHVLTLYFSNYVGVCVFCASSFPSPFLFLNNESVQQSPLSEFDKMKLYHLKERMIHFETILVDLQIYVISSIYMWLINGIASHDEHT